jgi:hypothetical protein
MRVAFMRVAGLLVLLADLPFSLSASVTLRSSLPIVPDGGSLVIYWDTDLPTDPATDVITRTCGPVVDLADVIDAIPVAAATPDTPGGGARFTNNVNLRCDYDFRLVRGWNSSAEKQDVLALRELGRVTVPVEGGPNAPGQGHISLADRDDEMWVGWVSGRQPQAAADTPTVRWGTSSGHYTRSTAAARNSSTTYTASDMCNAPANTKSQIMWRFPGWFHHVLLRGLLPSTTYYYVYGNERDGWSRERAFSSKPRRSAAVTTDVAVRFLAYGDQDWDDPAPGSPSTAAYALRDVLDGWNSFILHFGDISYGEGDVSDWDHWAHQNEPYATRAPYMVSLGNHEMDYVSGGERSPTGGGPTGFHPGEGWGNDSNGECGVPVFHRFRAPSNGNSIAWYSFDYGVVHVVQMSSEHDWTRGSPQYKWLEADLAAVDRSVTPWVVVTAHRMMYSTQSDASTGPALMRAQLEDLVIQHKVNLFLCGHQHSYERFCPVAQGKCVEDGRSAPTYINAGTAGAGIDYKDWFNSNISLVRSKQWGYLRVSATAHDLTVQFVDNSLGEEWDEVVLLPWM